MRKKLLIFILPLLILILVSCRRSEVPNIYETQYEVNSDVITQKDVLFENKSNTYNFKKTSIDTYYFNDSPIPYVSIEEYISKISYYNNKLVKEDNYLYIEKNANNDRKLQLLPDENKIIMNDYNFFNIDEKQAKALEYKYKEIRVSFVEENVDYDNVIDLNKYGLEIKKIDDIALLPFHVINTIFASESYYYVIYLGDKYIGQAFEDEKPSEKELREEFTIKPTKDYLEYNLNVIKFAFNEFYGLYDERQRMVELLEDYYRSEFLDRLTENKAYFKFLSALDDCHISNYFIGDLFTYNSNSNITSYRRSEMLNAYRLTSSSYSMFRYKYKSDYNYNILDNETVLVPITEFKLEGDSSPKIIGSYLSKFKEDNIKNVIFDVGLNGGGDTYALAYLLCLMTNEDVVLEFKNTKNFHISKEIFKLDSNNNGNYNDNDAYDNFNYYILSSGYSFSCANDFISQCKDRNIAKIIGQRSGGGACAVFPFVAPNGMLIQTSSINALYNNKGDKIEFGIMPDIALPEGSNYDVDKLLSIINEK